MVNERFFDRSGPDGLEGGQGGVAGGSPNSEFSGGGANSQAGRCPSCNANFPVDDPNRTTFCPECGQQRQGVVATAAAQQRGGWGVYGTGRPGYLRVPGGPISTNEMAGKLRLKYLGGNLFEMEMQGATLEHALSSSHSVMSHRLRALGMNQDRVMQTLIHWLFNEAKAGQEYVWDLAGGTRMVVDERGFRRHVEVSE